jgi:5-(hydroxymethyl)furfural/furfural oxidase
MYISIQSRSSWHALGARLATVAPIILRPLSRGRVALRSAEQRDEPIVEFNFVADEHDRLRLMDGVRRAVDFFSSDEVRPLIYKPFAVQFTDKIRLLNRVTSANALKSWAIAKGVQFIPVLSDLAMRQITESANDLASLANDLERLAELVRNNVAGIFHPAGTCRMGVANDPFAVTDQAGRVYGVEGLRVVDASIMPILPRAPTNLPALMVGEKLAAAILDGE